MIRLAPLALALVAAPAAAGEKVPDLEYVWQALNVVDTIQTLDCLKRKACVELNPLIGRDPSAEKLIAIKAGSAAAHFIAMRIFQKHKPEWVKPFEIVSVTIQGGVVAANMRFTF